MLPHKNNGSEVNIALVEYGTALNDKNEIVYVFNNHFLSAGKNIGISQTTVINTGFTLADKTEGHDNVNLSEKM